MLPSRDLLSVCDACRAADFVVLVMSAHEPVDETGELLIRCITAQGVSTVIPVVTVLSNLII